MRNVFFSPLIVMVSFSFFMTDWETGKSREKQGVAGKCREFAFRLVSLSTLIAYLQYYFQVPSLAIFLIDAICRLRRQSVVPHNLSNS